MATSSYLLNHVQIKGNQFNEMVLFLLVRPWGEDFHLISWFPICSRMAMALEDEDIQAYKSHCHCKFPALFIHSHPRFYRVC